MSENKRQMERDWIDEGEFSEETQFEQETEQEERSTLPDSRVQQSMDLTNSGLKRSVEKLSQECAAKKPRIAEERHVIYQIQESNEKLSNKIEMLEYSRTESFKIYSEMKESCESLLDEQKKVLSLIEDNERGFEHVKSFIMSCKYHMDQVKESAEKRKHFYRFTFQEIKDKGSKVISENKGYLKELEKFFDIINAKIFDLNTIDNKSLEEARRSHKNLVETNQHLYSSLEEEINKKQLIEEEISKVKIKSQQKRDELKESSVQLKKEINEKECIRLKGLSEERQQFTDLSQELASKIDEIKTKIEFFDQGIERKQKEKNNLNESIINLNETLTNNHQSIAGLNALEPKLADKTCEMKNLKERIEKLSIEVNQAENDLATNTAKLNEILPVQSEMERNISNLETNCQQVIADIDKTEKDFNKEVQSNQEARKQIKICEEKIVSRESLINKEKEFLESIANSYQKNLDSLRDKLKTINQKLHQLNSETCAKQKELNMMASEIMIEKDIQLEMKTRDREEQSQTIAKFKQLQDLLELLDKEVINHKQTKESLSKAFEAQKLEHTSQIQAKKTSIEEMKKKEKSEIEAKQKNLLANNSENNKLNLLKDDLNRLVRQMENNKDLYACGEMKLKSHVKWAQKQFKMVRSPLVKPPVFNFPEDAQIEDTWKPDEPKDKTVNISQTKVKPISKQTSKDSVNIKTRSMAAADSAPPNRIIASSSNIQPDKEMKPLEEKKEDKSSVRRVINKGLKVETDKKAPVKNKRSVEKENKETVKKESQFIKPKPIPPLVTIDSDSESVSPINDVIIVKTPISQLSTPKDQPSLLSKIPFFTNKLKKKENIIDTSFITTESSSVDSSSTIELKPNIKVEKMSATTSTPIKELEDNDSDLSFTKSLKHTNKVLLKSRLLNKERVKKAKLNDTIICLDTDED